MPSSLVVQSLRLLGLALLLLASVALTCENRDKNVLGPNDEFQVELTVNKHNQSADRIHIFRDVLETFGQDNRLEAGEADTVFVRDVEALDDVNWVAGRDGVRFGQVGCITPSGTPSPSGATRQAKVSVVWNGTRLSCVGWSPRG